MVHAFIHAFVLTIVLTIFLFDEETTNPANDGHNGDIIPVLQVLAASTGPSVSIGVRTVTQLTLNFYTIEETDRENSYNRSAEQHQSPHRKY
ncbi:MAG: hypothetical protein H7Z16_19570 [Pyrinomonadaceae bacterium]|nr:hypothetical protein [Pyrinomonadaceae bacterium]